MNNMKESVPVEPRDPVEVDIDVMNGIAALQERMREILEDCLRRKAYIPSNLLVFLAWSNEIEDNYWNSVPCPFKRNKTGELVLRTVK